MLSASLLSPNEYLRSIAADIIVAIGFALSLPAMSGADPWLGSYRPNLPSPRLAEGSIPKEPVTILASSESISPNIFSVRITSNCAGLVISCMAQLSTSMLVSFTSGKSFATSATTCLQSLEESSTFALSTLQTSFLLPCAASKALLATLSISSSVYTKVSTAFRFPSTTVVLLSPK